MKKASQLLDRTGDTLFWNNGRKLTPVGRLVTIALIGATTLVGGNQISRVFDNDRSMKPISESPEMHAHMEEGLEQKYAQDLIDNDQHNICLPGAKLIEFTFRDGDGLDAPALRIKGSGQGQGAACWTEAQATVKNAMSAVGIDTPGAGDIIRIPEKLTVVETK